jgi:hypothetical protein
VVLRLAHVVPWTLPDASEATPLLAKPPRSHRIYLKLVSTGCASES